MFEYKIKKIFKENLSLNVQSIKDISNGVEQIVKIVETKEKKFVIKFPREGNEIMVFREKLALDKLKHLNEVPVPKVVFYKEDEYIIETCLPGETMIDLILKNSKNIYMNLGKFVNQIHQVELGGFGEITSFGKGKHESFKNYAKDIYYKLLKTSLEETKVFKKKQLKKIELFILKRFDLFKESKSRMLHNDYDESNVLIFREKVSGIIDFGDVSAGPIEHDLSLLYINNYSNKNLKYFLDGYGQVDLEKIKWSAVFRLHYLIPYWKKNKPKKEFERMVFILKDIVGVN